MKWLYNKLLYLPKGYSELGTVKRNTSYMKKAL